MEDICYTDTRFVNGSRKLVWQGYFEDHNRSFTLTNNNMVSKEFNHEIKDGKVLYSVLENCFVDGFVIGLHENDKILRLDAYNYNFDKIASGEFKGRIGDEVAFKRFVSLNRVNENDEELAR
ncbi:MAG: hypothetical protein J5689_00260 [Clostridia bacterium]|nr:hypothetical protein [Clostridia bacterium]